jgi:hypothetical protein
LSVEQQATSFLVRQKPSSLPSVFDVQIITMAAHKEVVPSISTQERRQQTCLGLKSSDGCVQISKCPLAEKKQLEHTTTVNISLLCRLEDLLTSSSVRSVVALECLLLEKKLLEDATTVDISILCWLDSPWISHPTRAAQIPRVLIYKRNC